MKAREWRLRTSRSSLLRVFWLLVVRGNECERLHARVLVNFYQLRVISERALVASCSIASKRRRREC